MEVISEAIMHIEALPELEQILAQPDSLPEDCRRFFLPMPLEGEDLLVGRDDSFKLLDEALRHWQNGHPTSVAVVGRRLWQDKSHKLLPEKTARPGNTSGRSGKKVAK